MRWNKTGFVLAASVLIGMISSSGVFARTRLQDICTVYGQKATQLVGMGLVVGLNGTGDGGKNLVAIRALAMTLKNMNAPALESELKNSKNVALVIIHATVPKEGSYRGQVIDCFVSSAGGAKSLRGGRLLPTPLETADLRDERPVALASGALRIVGQDSQTTGVINGGAVLEQNFIPKFIDVSRNHTLTLLLNETHRNFALAADIADVLNQELSPPDSGTSNIPSVAKAISGGMIEVKVPPEYQDSPVDFVGLVMTIGIESPQSQARVIVDTRTQQIVISGNVEISPVIAFSKSLAIEIGGVNAPAIGAFVPVVDPDANQGSENLAELVAALRQLQAPPDEVIDIIRMIHKLGKLHAIYEER